MQVNKGAATQVGADHSKMTDPAAAVQAGSKYLAWCIKQAGGDVKLGVELYKWGVGVKAALASGTRGFTYAPAILASEKALRKNPSDPMAALSLIHK